MYNNFFNRFKSDSLLHREEKSIYKINEIVYIYKTSWLSKSKRWSIGKNKKLRNSIIMDFFSKNI